MAERPLLSLTVLFAAGIFLAMFAPLLVYLVLILLVLCTVLFAVTRRPLWGLKALWLAFLLSGVLRYRVAIQRAPDDVSRLASSFIRLTGRINSEVETAEKARFQTVHTALFTLTAQSAVLPNGDTLPVTGDVEVRVSLPSPASATASNDSEHLPRYGDTLVLRGRLIVPDGPRNPGGFDYRAYLARRGIYATLTARHPTDWQVLSRGSPLDNPVFRLAFVLRERILQSAHEALPPTEASALNGILLGARADLPSDLREAFERTGTTHILATAGLHVGMVVVLVMGFLRRARIARRPALVFGIVALAVYALMAGGRPSVVRAVVVACVTLFGELVEREPDLPNALALAALILLLFNPCNLADIGFQLSFATVITIVALMPLAEDAIQDVRKRFSGEKPGARWSRYAAELIIADFFLAVTAQIGAAPLVAFAYNEFSLVSVLANTLVVPVIALVLGLGCVAAMLQAVAKPLAWLPFALVRRLLDYVLICVKACAALPGASLNVAAPSWVFLVVYYICVGGLAWRWSARSSSSRSSLPD